MLAIVTPGKGAASPVELVMHVSRGDDNRLTGSVRPAQDTEAREFSGMLELMRVFEDLVPVDRSGQLPHGADGDQIRTKPKS
jgi:hypothetical protein